MHNNVKNANLASMPTHTEKVSVSGAPNHPTFRLNDGSPMDSFQVDKIPNHSNNMAKATSTEAITRNAVRQVNKPTD
jgi:hypothetical protein